MKNLDMQMEKITGGNGTRSERQRQEILDQRKQIAKAEKESHSLAYDMRQDFKELTKKLVNAIIALAILWFVTIAVFVGVAAWFLDTYEMTSYELSTEGGGNANYVGNDMMGDINNGESDSQENQEEEKEVAQSMVDANATVK